MTLDYSYLDKIDARRLFQLIGGCVAFACALFLLAWIVDYVNIVLDVLILTKVSFFLKNYWVSLTGFVLLAVVWDYVYPLYQKKLVYVKPIVNATLIMFGLWVIAILLKSLTEVMPMDAMAAFGLNLVYTLYYDQFVVIFLLFILIGYSRLYFDRVA